MQESTIKWEATKTEIDVISKIIKRASKLFEGFGIRIDLLSLSMDIEAVHSNGCPLRLVDLLFAANSDFTHDIAGIMKHIDRKTGKLTDCFLPRYADKV